MKLGVFWKFIVMKKEMPEGKGKSFSFLYAALFLLFLGLFSGCGNKFFDPSQVGRFRPVPAVNVIWILWVLPRRHRWPGKERKNRCRSIV